MTRAGRRVLAPAAACLAAACSPGDAPVSPSLELPRWQAASLDDGRRVGFEASDGAVVVNVWATWCEPCRAEMPSLDALAQKHPQDVVVLAVNYQEAEPRIRRYLETVNIRLPVVLDRDGAAAKAWTRRIFPTTVIIDAAGKPRIVVTGEYDWAGPDAARLIEPLLRTVSR